MADDFGLDDVDPRLRQAALVAALRRQQMVPSEQDPGRAAALQDRQRVGLMGELTGDRVLAPAGAGILRQAQQEAQLEAMAPVKLLHAKAAAQRADAASENADSLDFTRHNPLGSVKSNGEGQLDLVDRRTGETKRVDDTTRPVRQLVGGKGGAGGAPASSLTPAALDLLVENGYRSGVEPSFGRDYAKRDAYRNRMAELHPGADLVGNHASTRANTADLTEATKQAGAVDVNEGKALADLGIATERMKPLFDVGSPFANTAIRKLQEKSGNPEVSAFLVARAAAVATVNKVLNSGTLTESARHEAQDLLREDLTPAQFAAAVDVLKQDMARSKEAMHKRVDEARARISGKKPASEGPSTPPTDRKAKIQARIKQLDPDRTMDPEQLKAQLAKEFPPEVSQR